MAYETYRHVPGILVVDLVGSILKVELPIETFQVVLSEPAAILCFIIPFHNFIVATWSVFPSSDTPKSAYCWGISRKYPFGYPFVYFMAILHKWFPQSENQQSMINFQWNYQCLSSFIPWNSPKRSDFPWFSCDFADFLCRLQHLQASAAPLVPPGGHGPFSQSYAGYCYLVVWNLEDFPCFLSHFSHFFGTRTPTDVHSFQGSKPQTNVLV